MALDILSRQDVSDDPGLGWDVQPDWVSPEAPFEQEPDVIGDLTGPRTQQRHSVAQGPLGILAEVALGVPQGVSETFGGAAKMLSALSGGQPQIEPAEATSLPRQYGMGVGSAIAPMGLGALGGLALGPPGFAIGALAGLGVMGLAEAWDAYQRELMRQKEQGESIDKKKALNKALLYGVGSAALESTVGRVIRPIGLRPSRILYDVTRRYSGSEAVARRALELAQSVVEEAAEEGSQSLLQDIIVEGRPTAGVIQAAAMGGAIAPLAMLFGRGAIRSAARGRELITGQPTDINVSRIMELAGVSAQQAADTARAFSFAERAKEDAARILESITRGPDIDKYVTTDNLRRIQRGELPVFFDLQTGAVDGGALLHAAFTTMREAGIEIDDTALDQASKQQIMAFANTLADIAAADQLASKHGQNVVNRIISGLRRQHESEDIKAGALPAIQIKPADERAKAEVEAGAAERRGAGYQDKPSPLAARRAAGQEIQEVSPALTQQKISEAVGKLITDVLKQVNKVVQGAAQQAQQQAAQEQPPQAVSATIQQAAQAPGQPQQQTQGRPRIRIRAPGPVQPQPAEHAPAQGQTSPAPAAPEGMAQAQQPEARPRIRIRRPVQQPKAVVPGIEPLQISPEPEQVVSGQPAETQPAVPETVRVVGTQALPKPEKVEEEKSPKSLGLVPISSGLPVTVKYKLIGNAAVLRRGLSPTDRPTINLSFGTRPPSSVARALRAAGFEYRPAQNAWVAIETPARRDLLVQILKDAGAEVLSIKREPAMILPSFEELEEPFRGEAGRAVEEPAVEVGREGAGAEAEQLFEEAAERPKPSRKTQAARISKEPEAVPAAPRQYPEPAIRLPKARPLEAGKTMADVAVDILNEVVHNNEPFDIPQLVAREAARPDDWRKTIESALAELNLIDADYNLVSIGAHLVSYLEPARGLGPEQRGRSKAQQTAAAQHLALRWLALGHAFYYGGIQGLVTPQLRLRLLQLPLTEPNHIGMLHDELRRAVDGAAVLAHYAGLSESDWDSIRSTILDLFSHLVARFPAIEADDQWSSLKSFLSNAAEWPSPSDVAQSRVRAVEWALPWALGPSHLRQYLRAAFNRMAVAATADPANRWYGYLADALFRLLFSLETGIPLHVIDHIRWSNIHVVGSTTSRGRVARHKAWLEVRYTDPDGGGNKQVHMSIGMVPVLQRLLRMRHARAAGRVEVAGEGTTPFRVDARIEMNVDPPLVAVPEQFKNADQAILATILAQIHSRLVSSARSPKSARMAAQVADLHPHMFATALTPDMLPWVNFVLRRTGQLSADGHNPMASGRGSTMWERAADPASTPEGWIAHAKPSPQDILRTQRWLKSLEAHAYPSVFWVPGAAPARWNTFYQNAGEQAVMPPLNRLASQLPEPGDMDISTSALEPIWSAYIREAWPGGMSPAGPPAGDPIADIMRYSDGEAFDLLFGKTPEEPAREAPRWMVPASPKPTERKEAPRIEPLKVETETAGAAPGPVVAAAQETEAPPAAEPAAAMKAEPLPENQPLFAEGIESIDAEVAKYGGRVLVRLDYGNLAKLADDPAFGDLILPTKIPQTVLPAGAARGSTMTASVVYAVIPAAALSKLANILPGEYQTRDRAALAAREEAVRILGHLKPGLLLASESATTGAPIIDLTQRPDGTVPGVIAGNLRSMILLALANAAESHPRQYNAYVQAVRAFASAYNIDISGIDRPVLVRVAIGYEHPTKQFETQYEAAAEFARLSNAQVGTSMSVAERASLYEPTILRHIGDLEFTESGDLTAASVDRLVGWLAEENLEIPRLTSKDVDTVTLNRIVRYVFLYNTMRAVTEDAASVYKMVDQIVSDDAGRRLLAVFLRRLTALNQAIGRYVNVRGPGSQDQVNIFGYGIRALLMLYNVKPQHREEYARTHLLNPPPVLDIDPISRLEAAYFTRQFAYLALVAPDALPAVLDDYIQAVADSSQIMAMAGSLFAGEPSPADDIASGHVARALQRIVKKHAPNAVVSPGQDIHGMPDGHYENYHPSYSVSLDQQLQYELDNKTVDDFIRELEAKNPESPVAYALRSAQKLGIFRLLPGLRFAWARGVQGYAGLYINSMKKIVFLGDETGYHFGVTAHELLHALFTLLPEQKRLEIDQLRRRALMRALRRNPLILLDSPILLKAQRTWGVGVLDVAASLENIPRAFYHLLNAEEFFVWMLQGRAERELINAATSRTERNLIIRIYRWLRDALRRIASWAKEVRERFAGIRTAEEMRVANELWAAIVEGRYTVHGAASIDVPTRAVSEAGLSAIAPAPAPGTTFVPPPITQPMSVFVESANRAATARVRQILQEIGSKYSQLVSQESRWLDQAKELREDGKSDAEIKMRDTMKDIARVLDIEALQNAGFGNIYEPEWLGRYWRALQDISATYGDRAAWDAANEAFRSLRARFYAWIGILYARDLANAASRVERLERELASLKSAGTMPEQPPPNLLELETEDEPYIAVAYPNYQDYIQQLEKEIAEAKRQLAESEQALVDFLVQHSEMSSREAIPGEVNPITYMVEYLQANEVPLPVSVDLTQWDPAVFREVFAAYVDTLAQRVIIDDPLAFEVRVQEYLLGDVHLNALAKSDHRIAEIGLADMAGQLAKALDALYNPPSWMREEQKRAIAAAFVKAVLNYGLAKEKAEAAYAARIEKLRSRLLYSVNRLLARGRLKAVADALEQAVTRAYAAGYSGYAAADMANALLRFALTLSGKAKETFRRNLLNRLDRFAYLLMRIALAGMKSGLSDTQRRRFYTRRIAALINNMSLPDDEWWVAEEGLLEQIEREGLEEDIEEDGRTGPLRIRWEDVPSWTGLSEEMLAIVMDMIGQNSSIGEALRGLILAMVDKSFDSERQWITDMVRRLERKMAPSDEPINPEDVLDDVVFMLGQLAKRSDPVINQLRKELFEIRAELEAIARAREIWNSFTKQSFPRADGSGDTAFWDVYYKALEVSQLSRVMSVVAPEQARQGSGTIVLRGFELPRVDYNSGEVIEKVKINDVIVTPAMHEENYATLTKELDAWYQAAVEYIREARAALQRYRDYQERLRKLPPEQRDKIARVPAPHEMGFDIPTANGLENALALHSPYLFGLLWREGKTAESEENAVLASLTNVSFIRTFEALTRAAPPGVRHGLRIWMTRWANMRLGTAKIVAEHKPKILAAKIKAIERTGILDEQSYNEFVWQPLAEIARQHGAEIREGMRLRTGHAVTKEDIELLKEVHNFHTALMRLAQRIQGFDPTQGVVEAVVGTFVDAGDSEFTRLAASVGTYELPRTLNEMGQRLIDKAAIALKQIDDDEALRNDFEEKRHDPRFFENNFMWHIRNETFVGKLMSVWLLGEGNLMAAAYLTDSLEHKANIGINRSDQWISVLRLAAKRYLKDREDYMRQHPGYRAADVPPVSFEYVAQHVAAALIELDLVPGDQPNRQERALAIARMNIFNDLVAMSQAAVRAANAYRFNSMATAAGATSGRSFLNEFTKPAGTLWLPSAAYDYGALTDAQIEVAATRAQAYSMVQFMLAAARALRWVREYESELELFPVADRKLLRQVRIMRRAMEHLVDSLKQLTSLAWTNKTVRDPLWLAHVKSTLLSDLVVTLRNLTLGPILAYMQSAQLLNASKLFVLAVTFGSWAKRAASFVYDMIRTGAKIAWLTARRAPPMLRAVIRKKELREMFESFLEELAEAAITETAQTMHRYGISISRRTAYTAYLTLLQSKIARTTGEYMLTQEEPVTGTGRLMRLGARVRAAAQAATQILRAVGTEIADVYLNAMAVDAAIWIERDLQRIVQRVWETRVGDDPRAIAELARTGFLPGEPLASFRLTDDEISDYHIRAERAEHARMLRAFYEEAGLNLDHLVYYKLAEMARAYEQMRGGPALEEQNWMPGADPLAPKIEIELFNDEQRANIIRALARRFNMGDIVNRPIAGVVDSTKRTMLTFMGYSINFLLQLIAYAAGRPRGTVPERLLLALWRLFWLGVAVQIFAQISIFTTNRVREFIYRITPTVPSIFDREFWQNRTLALRSTMYAAMLGLPLIGDLMAWMTGTVFGNRGWSLTDRVLAVGLIDNTLTAIIGTLRGGYRLLASDLPLSIRLAGVVHPTYQLMQRYLWYMRAAEPRLSDVRRAVSDLKNARALASNLAILSGVATEGRKAHPGITRAMGRTDTTKQTIMDQLVGAAANRDAEAFRNVLNSLVTYFRETGAVNPEQSAKAALQGLNPLRGVVDGRNPTEEETAKILAAANDKQLGIIRSAIAAYDWANSLADSVLGSRQPSMGGGLAPGFTRGRIPTMRIPRQRGGGRALSLRLASLAAGGGRTRAGARLRVPRVGAASTALRRLRAVAGPSRRAVAVKRVRRSLLRVGPRISAKKLAGAQPASKLRLRRRPAGA